MSPFVRTTRHAPAALLAVMLAALACEAAAQGRRAADTGYPARPLRQIVTSEAGSAPDLIARIVALKLAEAFGQQVVVDNRAGATGVIGYDITAKSAPDGYTFTMATVAKIVSANVYRDLPYDPVKSFTHIAHVASVPLIAVVPLSLPVASVKELVEHARVNPGKLNYGSPGLGSAQHLTTELLQIQTGVKMVHIPYKSGTAAVTALLTGESQLFFAGLPPALPQVKAGRLRALAVTTEKRFPSVPDVATMAEAGLPGFVVDNWHGIIGPAGIPGGVVARLNGEIVRLLAAPDVRERLLSTGAEANPSTPEAFRKLAESEVVKWQKAALGAGLKKQ